MVTLEKILQGGSAGNVTTTDNQDSYTADTESGRGTQNVPVTVSPNPTKDTSKATNTNVNASTVQMPSTNAGATKKVVGAAPERGVSVPKMPTHTPLQTTNTTDVSGIAHKTAVSPDVLPKVPIAQRTPGAGNSSNNATDAQDVSSNKVTDQSITADNIQPNGTGDTDNTDQHKRKLSYTEMWNMIHPYHAPTAEEQAAEAKRERANRVVAAIGDGITSIANVVGTAHGAKNMYSPSESLSAAYKQRYDELRAQRQAEQDKYTSGYLRAQQLDKAEQSEEANRNMRKQMSDAENARQIYEMNLKNAQWEAKRGDDDRNFKYKQYRDNVSDSKWSAEQKQRSKSHGDTMSLGWANYYKSLMKKGGGGGSSSSASAYAGSGNVSGKGKAGNYYTFPINHSGRGGIQVPTKKLDKSTVQNLFTFTVGSHKELYKQVIGDTYMGKIPSTEEQFRFLVEASKVSQGLRNKLYELAGQKNPEPAPFDPVNYRRGNSAAKQTTQKKGSTSKAPMIN